MRKQILPVIAVLCLAALSASGQDSKIRKAEEAMQLLQYPQAIRLYEEVLAKKGDQKVQICLAEAYRKNQDYERAAAMFAKVSDWSSATPEYLLQYGQILMQTASCAEAQPVYNNFIERKPYDSRTPQMKDVCAYMDRIRNKNEGQFEIYLPAFNTTFNEMSPVMYGDGLVFASNRLSPKGAFLDLFFIDQPLQASASVAPFVPELNTKLHEATASFSADMNRIFFTRSRENAVFGTDSRIVPLEILTATRQDGGAWSKPEALNLTDPIYSAAHPCLSPDGKRLLFSSDRPGGFGGKDLYYTDWNGSSWGPPVNLGPEINTEGDELFPYLSPDNRLYFTSDGHIGLGGYDLFSAASRPYGSWADVENAGAPFNSPEDDFALVFSRDGLSGFFSSNRPGGAGGDDVYAFRRIFHPVEIFFQDAVTGNRIEEVSAQTNCGALIGGNLLRLPVNDCCIITASASGYENGTKKICGTDAGADFSKPFAIELEREKVYALRGVVKDERSGSPLAGAAIHVFEQSGELFAALVSDQEGRFTSNLSRNKCYKFKVEKGDYFARTLDEVVCAEGSQTMYILDVLLQPFWISAAQSRRPLAEATLPVKGVFLTGSATGADENVPFLLQIYYDQFSSSVREDALPEMERLLHLLNDNPSLVMEISSHTDTRGDKAFNQRLSQKRAENVVKWLIEKGVGRNRLVAKGYGESRPVNRCVDGIICPETEHQLNRRTEFRVIGKLKQDSGKL